MFSPEGAVAATIDVGDISNLKITGKSDQLGRRTARYFELEGRRFGLEDAKYEALARLSEGVQKTKTFRDLVGAEWVEDAILNWMKAKWAGEAVSKLGDYLAERCEEDVKEHEMWFPVSHLSVESDLPFGNVVFRTITEEMMNRLAEDLQRAKEGRDGECAAQVDCYAHRQRTELQGLAAATIKVTAEPKRAYEVALRETELAVAALSVYHVAATTIPEVTSYCAVLGKENVEGVKHLDVKDGRVTGSSDQTVGEPVLNWQLSDEEVSNDRRSFGLDNVG